MDIIELERVAKKINRLLPISLKAIVFQSVIDMPIDPDHISIRENRLFGREIAKNVNQLTNPLRMEQSFRRG